MLLPTLVLVTCLSHPNHYSLLDNPIGKSLAYLHGLSSLKCGVLFVQMVQKQLPLLYMSNELKQRSLKMGKRRKRKRQVEMR